MNQYIRPFTDCQLIPDDVTTIKEMMISHRDTVTLDYHGYLDPRKTMRTHIGKQLRLFAESIGLRLAGIYAFTAHAGSVTSIHVDGDMSTGPLPWRLSYYAEGEAGVLSWYKPDNKSHFDGHVGAYLHNTTPIEVYKHDLSDITSAFVRTEIPHKLDTSRTITDRLTITATFLPRISWEELNTRLASYD